jgi:hypothetical protein
MASTDAVPRTVRQSSALFLVTPRGDVWRVFDSDDENGVNRVAPGSDPFVRARVFIGSGPTPVIRIYEFRIDEPRTAVAERLNAQLLEARPGA